MTNEMEKNIFIEVFFQLTHITHISHTGIISSHTFVMCSPYLIFSSLYSWLYSCKSISDIDPVLYELDALDDISSSLVIHFLIFGNVTFFNWLVNRKAYSGHCFKLKIKATSSLGWCSNSFRAITKPRSNPAHSSAWKFQKAASLLLKSVNMNRVRHMWRRCVLKAYCLIAHWVGLAPTSFDALSNFSGNIYSKQW